VTVWGITMVRDEADIIGATVVNMLHQVDHVLVADNLSRDTTRRILDTLAQRYPGRLHIVTDSDPGYYQSRKMTNLAKVARIAGADWVVPFDADEWWCSRWGTVAEVLHGLEAEYGIVTAELVDHMATSVDPKIGNPIVRLPWRRVKPLDFPKVACRTSEHLVIDQGNHWARYPGGLPVAATPNPHLVVHHYPYRSLEQFIRKVRNGADAYAATDLPEAIGKHWRSWGEMSDDTLRDIYQTWYFVPDPVISRWVGLEEQPPLIHDVPIGVGEWVA